MSEISKHLAMFPCNQGIGSKWQRVDLLGRTIGATRQLLSTVILIQVVVSDFLEILKVRAFAKSTGKKTY